MFTNNDVILRDVSTLDQGHLSPEFRLLSVGGVDKAFWERKVERHRGMGLGETEKNKGLRLSPRLIILGLPLLVHQFINIYRPTITICCPSLPLESLTDNILVERTCGSWNYWPNCQTVLTQF